MSREMLTLPLDAFKWFPEHRVLVIHYDDIKRILGNTQYMKSTIVVKGENANVEFKIDQSSYSAATHRHIYRVNPLQRDSKVSPWSDIVIWYFFGHRPVIYPTDMQVEEK